MPIKWPLKQKYSRCTENIGKLFNLTTEFLYEPSKLRDASCVRIEPVCTFELFCPAPVALV